MDRKSIAQEYFLLALNEKGNFSAMYREEAKAGIVAAGFMDLRLADVLTIEKKKILITRDLPSKLQHIASLYTYLKEKPRSIHQLMSAYLASTGSRIKQLTSDLGESLLADGSVTRETGGLFGNKTSYIPEKIYKARLIERIRSTITADTQISPHDTALISILKETKNFNLYFDKSERAALKEKLKEMKQDPQNKQLADMIHYVNNLTAAIVACTVIQS